MITDTDLLNSAMSLTSPELIAHAGGWSRVEIDTVSSTAIKILK